MSVLFLNGIYGVKFINGSDIVYKIYIIYDIMLIQEKYIEGDLAFGLLILVIRC